MRLSVTKTYRVASVEAPLKGVLHITADGDTIQLELYSYIKIELAANVSLVRVKHEQSCFDAQENMQAGVLGQHSCELKDMKLTFSAGYRMIHCK